jgi:sarcosine oxidase
VRPERAINVMVRLALAHGATLHAHEPVIGWQADDGGVEVRTARGVYTAERLIFCGGAWSGRLLRDLGVELVVTRQVLGWVWPRRPTWFGLGTLPVWAVDVDNREVFYGFPMMDDPPGFKLARDVPGRVMDPDEASRKAGPEDEQELRTFLQRFMPEADGPFLAMRVCMYTSTPDQDFIVDRHPRHANVVMACGFSGHGFKFAQVIGAALADLALHGRSALPIGFLSLARFQPDAAS